MRPWICRLTTTDGRDGRDGRRRRTTATDGRDGRTDNGTEDGRRTTTTDGRTRHNTTQHTTQHKLYNSILQYFHCLPLKTNTYEFHSIRKMISESRRIFLFIYTSEFGGNGSDLGLPRKREMLCKRRAKRRSEACADWGVSDLISVLLLLLLLRLRPILGWLAG